ncbi:MAG: Smr/MutS family protein [Deltaproteobacteria bacterium]|nr:Smr/MutS family protein [Deltaproteobacteria bacterium]
MKSFNSSEMFRPFENLKALIETKSFSTRNYPLDSVEDKKDALPDAESEQQIFFKAMEDVKPILSKNIIERNSRVRIPGKNKKDPEDEIVLKLDDLVKYGKGFVVSQTPEYMEGRGYNVSPEVPRLLHRGEFSIQAHIDLHGFDVLKAKDAMDSFLKDALVTGKIVVLVVHGRGLSSPGEPVLKTKVFEWLTCGFWRKWVIAFTSARLCDGGTGGTYVLLRDRPIKK